MFHVFGINKFKKGVAGLAFILIIASFNSWECDYVSIPLDYRVGPLDHLLYCNLQFAQKN